MAEEENEPVNASLDEDGAEEQSEGLELKKLLLFVVLPLILILGAVGAYFTGVLGIGPKNNEEAYIESHEAGKGDHGEEGTTTAFLEIPDMIVNLSSDSDQPRYLRLSVQLELKSEEDKLAVEKVLPRVIDQFQTYLRELRVRDLRGSAGIYRLQMELLSRVNAAAFPTEVEDVLFQEILIQ